MQFCLIKAVSWHTAGILFNFRVAAAAAFWMKWSLKTRLLLVAELVCLWQSGPRSARMWCLPRGAGERHPFTERGICSSCGSELQWSRLTSGRQPGRGGPPAMCQRGHSTELEPGSGRGVGGGSSASCLPLVGPWGCASIWRFTQGPRRQAGPEMKHYHEAPFGATLFANF